MNTELKELLEEIQAITAINEEITEEIKALRDYIASNK